MKEQLTQFIEAYALAKASNNAVLMQMATQALRSFLDKLEITAVEESPEDGPEETPVCPMPEPPAPAVEAVPA